MSTAFSVAAPVSARPADNVRKEKLVSMLVACCGQLEYTRLCVPSLLRHSRQPLELLFLDTGSLDGTAEYLAGIADAVPFRVDIVPVSDGAGADLQKKQDVLQVSGPYVVLLNNDTILTEGWLDRLLAVAAANPALGLIAPMSNYAPPPMLVEQMPFRISPELGAREQLALLDRFAKEWAQTHKGKWAELERMGGGCVLIKREVLQGLGLFPTRTTLGAFDLAALGSRARQASFRLAVCEEAFVYHFGARHPVRI